jgi:hypothetical protein
VIKIVCAAIVVCAVAAAPVTAQEPQGAARTAADIQAQHAMTSLEAVLENAVRYGAQMLDQRLQASSAANMVMLAGMARARGFRLDDYGVVFDVEFPSMRRSMVWSLEQLERRQTSTGRAASAVPVSSIKPQEIYLTEISNALADAIVDHSASITVGPDESLTVAARESVDRRFVPADPADGPMTIILRVKGSDLAALRDRKLTRDDVRKRVEIRRY